MVVQPPTMNPIISPTQALTRARSKPAAELSGAFQGRLSALYALSQQNQNLFVSPLGPVYYAHRHAWLPRFVFFGPHATDDSWRLSFLAGFDHRDLRASRALLCVIEQLAANAGSGHGLNLSFFPLIDVAGHWLGARPRALDAANWSLSSAPEINLLEKDARQRGYHGFIRVEATPPGDDVVSVRMREPAGLAPSPDVELISSEDTDPFPVRFERASAGGLISDGPLTMANDLSNQPFELTLRVPRAWPDEIHDRAVVDILMRFILRYRAFQAYGQHL